MVKTMTESEEQNYALFLKEREHIKTQLGNEKWITVYSSSQDARETTDRYCGLVKNSDVDNVLTDHGWELSFQEGFPARRCQQGLGTNGEIEYDRFGFSDAEPLVFIRNYHGFRDNHPEISEEFRFFHNLYYERKRDEFVKFDESGEEIPVVRFKNGTVLIRLKEIRQFLSIKEMHLALFFVHFRYSNVDVTTVPEMDQEEFYQDDLTVYRFKIMADKYGMSDCPTVSAIRGKKLIRPFSKEKNVSEKTKEISEEFIIGETPDGDVTYACEPNALNYLWPVYFKREVLQRYYNAPERFSVEDSLLRCKSSWGLRMDNNHEDVVIVYLGDLYRDLPAKERAYWKPFNIPPKGKISRAKLMRDFMAEPCNPEGKDLLFKQRYSQLNKEWSKQYGWPLFRQLKEQDQHFFQNLRVPLNNSQSEFDMQVLTLAKVLVDALNEAAIQQDGSKKVIGGINKFEIFLNENGYEGIEEGIALLRLVQKLRSEGVAHLKGSDYEKLAVKHGLADKELRPFFSKLLDRATDFIGQLISQTKNSGES